MLHSRRTLLTVIATAGAVGVTGCSDVGSCGPAEGMTVEDLQDQEPTGITNDFDDAVSLIGSIETADRTAGESIRIDDTTGLAELKAGPGLSWLPQNIPDDGTCISVSGYYVDDTHAVADVVLTDVSISIED